MIGKITITDENGEKIQEIPLNLKKRKRRKQFFDVAYVDDFREIMNTPYFQKSKEFSLKFNLCCAVADRLNTCVAYLNKHLKHPKTEEDFLSFLMFASMMRDAVDAILEEFDVQYNCRNEELFQFFKDVYINSKIYNSEKDIPTDDKFFEYFRSLTFAHPVETNRAKFIRKELKEKHYCPFVLINRFWGDLECVGARIYTNVSKDILDVYIPFERIKNYLKFKYEQLSLATIYLKQKYLDLETSWKNDKINRDLPPLEMLQKIKEKLEQRCEETGDISECILFLKYKPSLKQNEESTLEYQKAIVCSLPSLCDAIEQLDDNKLYSIFESVLCVRPKNAEEVDYSLGCIYTDLKSDIDIGRYLYTMGCVRCVMDAFAHKWVYIDEDMPADEIRFLISAACYLEENACKRDSL
ncbi:MAG: hypothetical protein SPL52_05630 [Fibrobacter sp.]|nr:hypothetical protein [Fibrobacter sp.]